MTLELAIRQTEILLALAFILQCFEQLKLYPFIAGIRSLLCGALLFGIAAPIACLGLCGLSLYLLHKHQGPYNGGSDRMSILILFCLTAAQFLSQNYQAYSIGYLSLQVTLSYFLSGWVKVKNPDWRTGQALRDVFTFSAYPVSESFRDLANRPRLLFAASWGVIALELAFPLSLWSQTTLFLFLGLAALFHLANACLFGLNRFFWIWLAAYPSLIWFQDQIFG